MPELAAAYFTGLFACCALTVLYVFLRRQRRHTDAAKVLQANLRKIDSYWSDNRDAVQPWTPHTDLKEDKKSQQAIGLTGLMLSLLSWIGFAFLLVIMLSERYFARSRRERRLFSSVLAQDPSLTPPQVQGWLEKLEATD